jgi:hypothetical protein
MKLRGVILAILFLVVISVAPARADLIFSVSLNTAPLVGHPAGPFSLDFQLNDGSQSGDGNNTATLSQFTFGGGSASGSASLLGGATGDLTKTVSLTDSSAFNEFTQEFNPGSSLKFTLDITTNTDPGNPPDLFSFAILDSGGSEIPTKGVGAFVDTFVDVVLGSPPTIYSFGSDLSRPPDAGGNPINLGTPVIGQPTTAVVVVPEPATFTLFLVSLTTMTFALLSRQERVCRRCTAA